MSLFIQNKYYKWYYNIIASAKDRVEIIGYSENHHIIPKCMGGSNSHENLVRLSAREHFICHLLLTKMTTGEDRSRMVFALWGMRRRNKFQNERIISNRTYEYLQKLLSAETSKMNSGTFESRFGKERAEELKQKFRQRKPRPSPNMEERQDMSERMKRAHQTNPWKRHFQFKQPEKKTCPICSKTMDLGNFSRHGHGPNCKQSG